jgi:tetratricopeptide (TPR) repeat protein
MSESLKAMGLVTPPVPSLVDDPASSGAATAISEAVSPQARDFTSRRVLIFALVLLCFVAFANSLTGAFVHDDTAQIVKNPLLGHWDAPTLKRALTRDFWAAVQPELAGDNLNSLYYRPFFTLFLMLGYAVAGLNPIIWHVIVVLLHALCAVLAFIVLDRTLRQTTALAERPRRLMAALAAATFAIHPAQAESVTWIAGLVGPLNTLLVLAAFYCYLEYKERRRALTLAAMTLTFALAVLTKESAIALIVIVFAHELVVFNSGARIGKRLRRASLYLLPLALVGIAYFAVRHQVLGMWLGRSMHLNFPDDAGLTALDVARTWPALLAAYGKLLIFPFNLSLLYDFGYVKALDWARFWAPLAILLAVGLVLLKLSRRDVVVRLAIIWLIVPLLPHLNTRVFVSDEIIHDRYLYLSLLGVGLLVAALLVPKEEPTRWLSGRARAAATAGLLLVLMLTTWATNRRFQSSESLWTDIAAHVPNARLSLLATGLHAEAIGDPQAALDAYEKVLTIHPDILDALNNSAFVYARTSRWDEAIDRFERVAAITPNRPLAHFNLSFAYAVRRRYTEAIREQQQAIDLDPHNARVGEWQARLAELQRRQAGEAGK